MDHAEFVRVWETGKDLREIGRKLGVSPAAASCRAFRLRRAGVKLRKLPKGCRDGRGTPGREIVSELNRLVETIRNGQTVGTNGG